MDIPALPLAFHGRDEVVALITALLVREQPSRIPILGPGGMGKTAVATVALHDPAVVQKYGRHILFISCESIQTEDGILAALAVSLQFTTSGGPAARQAVHERLKAMGCVLLVIDNLETALQSTDSDRVEQLIARLSDLPHLSIVITMRGNLPPDGVMWDRVDPLGKLSPSAARQIWMAIAGKEDDKLEELLAHLDGLPLAIRLMALQSKAVKNFTPRLLLAKYEKETTRILKTTGSGRLKSVDVSIRVSLESETMQDEPYAKGLLGVLSMLPDGAHEDALAEMAPSLEESLTNATSVLLRVGLAYEERNRIRVLSPVRDFVLRQAPPSEQCAEDLRLYVIQFAEDQLNLRLGWTMENVEAGIAEFGNISSVLLQAWRNGSMAHQHTRLLEATSYVGQFSYLTSYGDALPILRMARLSLSTGSLLGVAQCARIMGEILRIQGQYDAAATAERDAKVLFENAGDRHGVALCTRTLGDILLIQTRYDEAATTLREAKVAFAAVGDQHREAQCSQSLGDLLRMRGRYDEAALVLRETQASFAHIGDRLGMAQCLRSLGEVRMMQARYDEATALIQEAKVVCTDIGHRSGVAQCAQRVGVILRDQQRYPESVSSSKEALSIFRSIGHRDGAARCNESLGKAYREQGQTEYARAAFLEAKQAYDELGLRSDSEDCVQALAELGAGDDMARE
ncbi:TPR-like protein [Calocera cornea HHB12733]|uniref:TPR-like protein n=1 Tax=Calocera cornea HHB12733 TaxID=1353952 RepID=A0A165F2V7_9BASI|nr:TPR-like protein [Calocera cornea HHB12733]